MQNIKINHFYAEIAAGKPDIGYEYEGPVEDMPRNISPPVIIAGLPGAVISDISLKNIELKHPGGGNPLFAKISLESLDSVPEKPAAYPDFSMFRELPAWGIYIRHAREVQFTNLKLMCEKKDYRTAIVLDDVHQSTFLSSDIKEPGNKKKFYMNKSTEIIVK